MVESRWLRWIGPGVVALGAVGFIASTTLGAAARPWAPNPCAGPRSALMTTARDPGATDIATVRGAPWYRLDPVLAADGALRGQRLALGLEGDPVVRAVALPAESFAAGPFGRLILVGADDGAVSRLEAFNPAAGCAWSVAEDPSVIRHATIDPAGTGIYEMRVDRVSRADLGIWFRSFDARTPARRIMAPPTIDGRFGRTWSTTFTWDLAGDRLAIQSCGEAACRVRVIDLAGGSPETLDAPDLGVLVGLDGDRVVTYGSCRGLPCPVFSTDLATGERRVLAAEAGSAVLVSSPAGATLIHEVGPATGRRLRSVALDTGQAGDVGPIPASLRLQPSPAGADAATRLPSGWVVLAPDGRLPADGHAGDPQLRRITDGLTVQLDEAAR
jgi:hypothetical protein